MFVYLVGSVLCDQVRVTWLGFGSGGGSIVEMSLGILCFSWLHVLV